MSDAPLPSPDDTVAVGYYLSGAAWAIGTGGMLWSLELPSPRERAEWVILRYDAERNGVTWRLLGWAEPHDLPWKPGDLPRRWTLRRAQAARSHDEPTYSGTPDDAASWASSVARC